MKMVNLWPTNVMQGEFNADDYFAEYMTYCTITQDIRNEYENFLDNKEFSGLKNTVLNNFKEYLNRSGLENSFVNYKLNSWALNIAMSNSMTRHNHRNAQLSAVYYFLVDDAPGGEIVLHDPRVNANRCYPSDSFSPWFDDYHIKPKSGEFIIFPSFLYHSVNTYLGNNRKGFVADLFLKI